MSEEKGIVNEFNDRLEYMAHNAKKIAKLIEKSSKSESRFLMRDLDMLLTVMQEDFEYIKNNLPA